MCLDFAARAESQQDFQQPSQPLKFDEMTASLIHMANNLDASTEEASLNYVLLGRPHRDKTQSHPSYMEMIKGAIQTINNGKGSSKAAILKFIAQNYHVGENLPKVNNHLRTVLKKAVDNGDIEQARGHGATGSFRMGKEQEKMLQVGLPINTQPMMMLKEVRQKMETVSVSKKTDKPSSSTMKTKKPMMMKKKKGVMGKKRLAKPKVVPKAKGLKNKKHPMPSTSSSTTTTNQGHLEHKSPSAMRPEAPATTSMELRTGTRKSYC